MTKNCKHLEVRDGLFYKDFRCKLKSGKLYVRRKRDLCSRCPVQLSLDFIEHEK